MNEITNPYGYPYQDLDDKDAKHGSKMVIAMAYVPEQDWETPYDVMDGLNRGTLFPGLDKPFMGGGKKW